MKPAEFLAKYVALLAGGAVAVLATGLFIMAVKWLMGIVF